MSVIKKRNSPYWHIDFWLQGKRYCFSSGTRVKKDAERREAKTKAAIKEKLQRGPIKAVRDATFNQAAGDYYRLRGKHTADPRKLHSEIKRALEFVGKNTRVSAIDLRFMMLLKQRFLEKEDKGHTRKEDEYSDGTVNAFLNLVDRIVTYAITDLRVAVPNKAKPKQFLAPQYWRKRNLSSVEENLLEAVTDQDHQDAWKFLLETGLRCSPLCKLTWDQVDLKGRTITIPLKSKGKSVKSHMVYVSGKAMQILLRIYGQHKKFVFTTVAKRASTVDGVRRPLGSRIPLRAGTFSKKMKGAFERANISDFVVHDLRHTAAHRLWRKTGDIEVVRLFLGHADSAQTRRYINLTVEDVAFAAFKRTQRIGESQESDVEVDKALLERVLVRQLEDRLTDIRTKPTERAKPAWRISRL